MKKLRNNEGFTLLEMVIVVTIISILFLLTVPNIQKTLTVVDDKGCQALTKTVDSAILQYRLETGENPGSVNDLIAADLFDEEGVELVDEIVLFEDADEERRRQEAPVRVIPAREALHRAELPRDRAHDGLVVHPHPVLLDGLIEVLDDV